MPELQISSEGHIQFKGTLSELPVGSLLLWILNEQQQGELFIEAEGIHHYIFFERGYPVAFRGGPPENFLGWVLREKGFIDDAAYLQSLQALAEEEKLQGQILLEMGAISEENLAQALGLQIQRKLIGMFRHEEGQFFFQSSPELPLQDISPGLLNPYSLIANGIRQKYSEERLNLYLQPLSEQHIKLKSDRLSQRYIQRMNLDVTETAALDLLEKWTTTEAFQKAEYLDPIPGLILLALLSMADLLDVGDGTEVEEESAPSSMEVEPSPARNLPTEDAEDEGQVSVTVSNATAPWQKKQDPSKPRKRAEVTVHLKEDRIETKESIPVEPSTVEDSPAPLPELSLAEELEITMDPAPSFDTDHDGIEVQWGDEPSAPPPSHPSEQSSTTDLPPPQPLPPLSESPRSPQESSPGGNEERIASPSTNPQGLSGLTPPPSSAPSRRAPITSPPPSGAVLTPPPPSSAQGRGAPITSPPPSGSVLTPPPPSSVQGRGAPITSPPPSSSVLTPPPPSSVQGRGAPITSPPPSGAVLTPPPPSQMEAKATHAGPPRATASASPRSSHSSTTPRVAAAIGNGAAPFAGSSGQSPSSAKSTNQDNNALTPEEQKQKSEIEKKHREFSNDDINFYKVLEVSRVSSPGEIRNAYYKLSRTFHPDRVAGTKLSHLQDDLEFIFSKLNEAYSTLSSKELKQDYDSLLEDPDARALRERAPAAAQAEVHYTKAQVYLKQKEWKLAEEELRWSTQLLDDEGDFQAAIGWAIYNNDEREKAERVKLAEFHFEQAANFGADAEKLNTYWGLVNEAENNLEEAIKRFNLVLKKNPRNMEGSRNMRRVKSKLRNQAQESKPPETKEKKRWSFFKK